MNTIEKANAAWPALMAQTDVHSWQAAHPFSRATRRGAQIHAAHPVHLLGATRIAPTNVADPETRAMLADIVEDAGRMLPLCARAAQ